MSQLLQRSYYQASSSQFIAREEKAILGELVASHTFNADILQQGAWQYQIKALKLILPSLTSADVLFEFSIPRMGKRIDNILIIDGVIFIIEFKIGESSFRRIDKIQVEDYCLDLKNFHKGSHDKIIVPLLVITNNDKNISILTSQFEGKLLNQSGLLSIKPKIFVCNVDEQSVQKGNKYTKKFLEKFSKLKQRFLENDQKLEHLRVIENGYKIVAFRAQHLTNGVDTPKDLAKVRKFFK